MIKDEAYDIDIINKYVVNGKYDKSKTSEHIGRKAVLKRIKSGSNKGKLDVYKVYSKEWDPTHQMYIFKQMPKQRFQPKRNI